MPRPARGRMVAPLTSWETIMIACRSLAAAFLLSAVLVAPEIAAAADEPNPTPPPQTEQGAPMKKKTQTKKQKTKPKVSKTRLHPYHIRFHLALELRTCHFQGSLAWELFPLPQFVSQVLIPWHHHSHRPTSP